MIVLIEKIRKNLSANMLYYTLFAIISGITLGHFIDLKRISDLLLPVILIMIYPMMVNLSLSHLKSIKVSLKPLSQALFLNFIYAPVLMYILTCLFISDPKITLALMLLSIAPASSMGLGYLGLAGGHLLSGTVIVASAFLLSIFFYPIFGHLFALNADINVPITLIVKNLLIVLIIPLVLGVLTRELLERKGKEGTFLKVKPYFSSITLLFLYVLIFIIFASKSELILNNLMDIVLLLPVAVLFYGITVLILLPLNKYLFSFEYGHHQAVVFTSVSKNIALTIAILISAFGKEGQYLAIFPAIMSLFQAPFLMTYLKFSKKIRKWFEKEITFFERKSGVIKEKK